MPTGSAASAVPASTAASQVGGGLVAELAGQERGEGDPRALGGHGHGHVAVGLHRVDVGEGLARERARLVGLDVGLDRVGVERGAVVEGDAVTGDEGPHRVVVVVVERLEQVRLHLTVGVGEQQGVVDRVHDHVAGDGAHRVRRGPRRRGVGLDAVAQRAAGDGLGVRVGVGGAGRDVGGAVVRVAAVVAAAPAARGAEQHDADEEHEQTTQVRRSGQHDGSPPGSVVIGPGP